MRLCRFRLDELTLTGFYADDRVIPIDQAAEAYADDLGTEIDLPTADDLLGLLPPDGPSFPAAKALAGWLAGLDEARLGELSIPAGDVRLLVPVGTPRKILLLAGNYAAHVA